MNNTSIQEISQTRQKITVTIPATNIQEEEKRILKDIAKKVNVPGFRKGNAPLSLVKKKFAQALQEELEKAVISSAFKELKESTKEREIYLVADYAMDPQTLSPNGQAVITFTIDFNPQFELSEYKNIPLEKAITPVSEADIDAAVERIRHQQAKFNRVDTPAKKGDVVKLSYEGTINGELISNLVPEHPIYAAQKNTWEEAGSTEKNSISAIVEGIIGMQEGENKTVSMQYPQDFFIPALAGKEVSYNVSVLEIHEKTLPELNEDFVQSLQLKSIEDLRETIKKEFEKQREQELLSKSREQIANYLIEKNPFELPISATQNALQAILRTQLIQLTQTRNLSEQELEKEKEKMLNNSEQPAQYYARTCIILNAIAKKENLTPSQEDLSNALMQEAYLTRTKPQEITQLLRKNSQYVEEVKQRAINNKVLDFLYQSASLKERQKD